MRPSTTDIFYATPQKSQEAYLLGCSMAWATLLLMKKER